MFSLALYKWLKEQGITSSIIIMTNIEEDLEDEFIYGEPNIYHCVNSLDNGKTTIDAYEIFNGDKDYITYCKNVYDDSNPSIYRLNIINVKDKNDVLVKGIRFNTDWSYSWEDFYKIINSIKNKSTNKLNEKNNTQEIDSEGNSLSQEQIEFFKNSKVRDEKGKLLVTYHGTHTPGFLEFNPIDKDSKFGKYKFKDFNVNYFTSSLYTAQGYTDLGVGDVYGDKDAQYGNIYACYLNITNPYYVDNTSTSEIKSWQNIKDKTIRDKELREFDKFYNKWKHIATAEDLEELNKELYYFNREIKPSQEGNFDLVSLGSNKAYGAPKILMYSYEIEDLFDRYYYNEFKENVVGEVADDYYYTIDDIIKWVLLINKEKGTNYDGVIIEDIRDIGPKGSPFFTDASSIYATLKSSNQIKLINNKRPTTSNKINENELTE